MADEYIFHLMSYMDLLVIKALSVTDQGSGLAIRVNMCQMQTKTQIQLGGGSNARTGKNSIF